MMRVSYPLFDHPILLEENSVSVLVIENPRAFRTFMGEVALGAKGEESKCLLSKDYEELAFSKHVEVIFSLEALECNNRTVIQRLWKTLKKEAYDEELYLKTLSLKSMLVQYLQLLLQTQEVPLSFDELDVDALLKAANVKVETESQSFCEMLCAYVDTISAFLGVHVFFFFHLKACLDAEELAQFYEHCRYQKEQLFLCEAVARPVLEYEKVTIIDNDLCQIT